MDFDEKNRKATGRYGFPYSADKNGRKNICLMYRVPHETHYAKHSMKIKVHPEKEWDDVKQEIKPNVKQAAVYNGMLKEFKAKIDKMVFDYKGHLTNAILSEMLDGTYLSDEEKAKRVSFRTYGKKTIQGHYDNKDYGYTVYYNKLCLIDAFADYVENVYGNNPFRVPDITFDMVDRYVGYRFQVLHNESIEGVSKTILPIKETLKAAIIDKMVSHNDVAAILDYKLTSKKTEYNPDVEDEDVRALSAEQMQLLCNFQAKCRRIRTTEILDMFFFSFYACGLRLSDVLTLEWQHVDFDERMISKNQFKTKNRVDIPLNEKAMEILVRWKSYRRNRRFVFDLLPESFNMEDPNALLMQRGSKDKTFNRSLLSVSQKVGIDPPVKFHQARHTFAVMSINNAVPLHILSTLMGHSSVVSTEKTYAKYLKSTLDEEVMQKMNFAFNPSDDE